MSMMLVTGQIPWMSESDEKSSGVLRQETRSGWYFSKQDIENNSPSRKDGIDQKMEAQIRVWYCTYLQDLGMKLGVPQVTIATATLICHRFYLRQSHAKNDWQTVATACMFLACKMEDTPVALEKVTIAAYEMIHREDPDAFQRIRKKDARERQRALILIAERLVLATIGFDFNIQHPYKPLIRAMNKFGMVQKDVRQMAWNYVNDWIRSTMCLQFKPHYIAAGTVFITAKMHNIKLPSRCGYVWWHEFEVTPYQLDAVIQEMLEVLGYKKKAVKMVSSATTISAKTPLTVVEEPTSSPDSCVLSRPGSTHGTSNHDFESNGSVAGSMEEPICQDSSCGILGGVIDDVEQSGGVVKQDNSQADKMSGMFGKIDLKKIKTLRKIKKERETRKAVEASTNQTTSPDIAEGIIDEPVCLANSPESSLGAIYIAERHGCVAVDERPPADKALDVFGKLDIDRIRSLRKTRKEREIRKKTVAMSGGSEESWIERELEAGIELSTEPAKKQKIK